MPDASLGEGSVPALADLNTATDGSSVFPRRYDARLRHRISAAGVRKQRGWGIHCELFYARRHIVLAFEHLVKRNFPPSVGGHAAHARNQARLYAAFDLVVRFALSNGVHQIIPLVLIRILFIRAHLGFP